MLKKLKLNLYSDKLAGYAYETDRNNIPGTKFIIYLVIYDNNKYKFIEYEKISKYNFETEELYEKFKLFNVIPMEEWTSRIINENNKRNNINTKTKVIKKVKIR